MNKYTNDQINNVSSELSKVLLNDGSHLKNPRKFTHIEISERVKSQCTDLLGNLIVTDEQFNTILASVTKALSDAKRIAMASQGEGYNVWMRDLKLFLDHKNENGFGARCYRKCKELQKLMNWNDEQMTEVAKCFDKGLLTNNNHCYRGIDSNEVYRDNTSNLGKITNGLGDKKQDVKRGSLDISK